MSFPPTTTATPATEEIRSVTETSCCIVGGGPAGIMLSLLLSRRGVPVTLLEMHKDFDREFRGDTIHPSIMEVLDQIGLRISSSRFRTRGFPALRFNLLTVLFSLSTRVAHARNSALAVRHVKARACQCLQRPASNKRSVAASPIFSYSSSEGFAC